MAKSDRRSLLQIMGVAFIAPGSLIGCNVGGTTNQTTVVSSSKLSTASASGASSTTGTSGTDSASNS